MKLVSKLRPKLKRLKLKTFGDSWPKLRKAAYSRKLTEKLANIGKIIWSKMLKNFAHPGIGALKNPWIA
jgi:hypothetical protein